MDEDDSNKWKRIMLWNRQYIGTQSEMGRDKRTGDTIWSETAEDLPCEMCMHNVVHNLGNPDRMAVTRCNSPGCDLLLCSVCAEKCSHDYCAGTFCIAHMNWRIHECSLEL